MPTDSLAWLLSMHSSQAYLHNDKEHDNTDRRYNEPKNNHKKDRDRTPQQQK